MNKFTQLLLILPSMAFAQDNVLLQQKAKSIEYSARTNAPSFIELKSNAALKITDANSDQWARELFNLRSVDQFKFQEKYEDQFVKNMVHYKYQQRYNGVPVEFSMIRVHEQNGMIKSVNGDFQLNLSPVNAISISANAALENAIAAVPANKYKWEMKDEERELRIALNDPNFSYDPITELVLLPIGKGADRQYYYAYKLDIYAHDPDVRYDVYVDASNGSILKKLPKLCTIDVTGTAHTKYHGVQQIRTDSIGPNQYILRENNRSGRGQQIETRDCNRGNENGSVNFVDDNNIWDTVNIDRNEAALDCHFAAEMTYDYYYDTLNRDSYNGSGAKLLQYVHFDNNWFNAQWTGSYSRYGDGNGEPLTSIDVVSHEISHGVTQYTAGLIYESEAGALNESFSDIFGTAVEFGKLNSGASWIIGKNSFALRNMAAPNDFGNPDTYGGSFWTPTDNCQPSGNNDYCGVHNNSGVQNFWYYLLSQGGTGRNDKNTEYSVVGIGIHKAARIAYKNLRDYLSFESNYEDARNGSIQAAIDLYGFGSQEYQSVLNAWHAVGVGKAYTPMPVADFQIEELVCEANTLIQFKNTSGAATTYLWNFGDGSTSNSVNPTHFYINNGVYNVSLIATSPNGSDTLTRNNFVYIFNDVVLPSTCNAIVQAPLGTTGIYKVKLADMEHESFGPNSEDGYMDFTCYRAFVGAGNYYPMEVTTYVTSEVFTRVYIDWNNDASFDPATELVMKTDKTIQNHYDTLFVPKTAVKDIPLRMRVISGRASLNTPDVICSNVRNGQIEDYTVVVSSSIGIDKMSKLNYSVYPNPSNGQFNISGISISTLIRIMDASGKVMYTKTMNADGSIDLSDLSRGLYLLEITNNETTEVQKIVIK